MSAVKEREQKRETLKPVRLLRRSIEPQSESGQILNRFWRLDCPAMIANRLHDMMTAITTQSDSSQPSPIISNLRSQLKLLMAECAGLPHTCSTPEVLPLQPARPYFCGTPKWAAAGQNYLILPERTPSMTKDMRRRIGAEGQAFPQERSWPHGRSLRVCQSECT